MNNDNTVRHAGGFIIQLMPFADEQVIGKLEENLSKIEGVTDLLNKDMTLEMILEQLLGEFDLEILDKSPTAFECNCSKERVEKAVISIGRKDIQEMINDNEPVEVNCHFCNNNYIFSIKELEGLLSKTTH